MEDSHSLKNIDVNIHSIQTTSENSAVYLEMQLINFPCFSSLIGSQIARAHCPRILRLKSRLYSFFRGWHFLLEIEYSQV